MVRLAWLTLLAASTLACSIQALDGSDKACPCARGLVCDAARNRCVEPNDASSDAGTADASDDTAVDAPRDAGDIDVGFDASSDAKSDGGDPEDAGFDGRPDARDGICPDGALYCINFDDVLTPYDEEGDGSFTFRPGYAGEGGFFQSLGSEESYIEAEVELPSTFYARLWLRNAMSSEPILPIAEFSWGLGSDDRVRLYVLEAAGMQSFFFGFEDFEGVFQSTGPTPDWTCVQLMVSPTEVSIDVNESGVNVESVTLAEEWEDMAFGVLELSDGFGAVSIDEIVVGASPIRCEP